MREKKSPELWNEEGAVDVDVCPAVVCVCAGVGEEVGGRENEENVKEGRGTCLRSEPASC